MEISAKLCPACRQVKDATAFSINRSRKDGLQAQCRECKKRMQQSWYVRNRETHRHPTSRHPMNLDASLLEPLADYLRLHPCADCGEADPLVLHFEQANGKRLNLTLLLRAGGAWMELRAVLESCTVRCANCRCRRDAVAFGLHRLLSVSPQT